MHTEQKNQEDFSKISVSWPSCFGNQWKVVNEDEARKGSPASRHRRLSALAETRRGEEDHYVAAADDDEARHGAGFVCQGSVHAFGV